jgi:hypothetical protein
MYAYSCMLSCVVAFGVGVCVGGRVLWGRGWTCPAMYKKTFKDVTGEVTLDCDTTGAACTIVVSLAVSRVW